ncbi:PhzF family phenazine biosynthesis isomerase [Exiguobacterium sp. PvP096]
MQLIAAQTGFTETTFVSRLNESVPRFRYFSPKSEMNLCGHGTIAAWTALQEQNFNSERNQLIETKIGRLNIGEVRTPKGIQVQMQQGVAQFSSVLKQFPEASIHPICLETYLAEADMHGRHFSATQSGTKEDPVTGTASGVMGAYYAKYINPQSWGRHTFRVEQGHEMKREGLVEVTVNYIAKNWEVMIAGVCVRKTSRILII